MENVRGTRDMTKAKWWHLKKNGTSVGKVAVVQSKRPFKIFSSVALQHCHACFFQLTSAQLLAWLVFPRPEQLVRSTPLLPYAMPKDGKRGKACAQEAGRDYFNG